jgi:hypothetical protein
VWFCVQWCYLELDLVVGPTPPPGSWEGGGGPPVYQMELFMVDQPLPLGSGVTVEPFGACWSTLCGFVQWVFFGAGSGGRTPPPGTVLEGGGGRSLVPNGTIPHGWSTFL